MREVVWCVVGAALGVRALGLARRDIASLRAAGTTYGTAHLGDARLALVVAALTGGLLWWSLSVRFGSDATVLVLGLWSAVLLRLLVIDVDTHVLPRSTTLAATVLTVAGLALVSLATGNGDVASMCLGGLAMWAAMKLLEVASRGDLGGGDVTLAPLLGVAAGWLSLDRVATVLVASFALGGITAVVLLALRRVHRRSFLAFGPFLIVGGFIGVLR